MICVYINFINISGQLHLLVLRVMPKKMPPITPSSVATVKTLSFKQPEIFIFVIFFKFTIFMECLQSSEAYNFLTTICCRCLYRQINVFLCTSFRMSTSSSINIFQLGKRGLKNLTGVNPCNIYKNY